MSISEREFNAIAAATPLNKREAPFSLRLSFDEKALLHSAANGVPLGAYIKAKFFDEPLEKVRRRNATRLAAHLMNAHDNEHVELHELRGFMTEDDLHAALKAADAIAKGHGVHGGSPCVAMSHRL